jgi:trehalose-6-phosphate synthase
MPSCFSRKYESNPSPQGTVEFVPIHFMHRSIPFDELVALYAVSDVCLVSSTRDGMNLVSYEYISAQQNNHGVMILSEFAGAAQSLNGKAYFCFLVLKKKRKKERKRKRVVWQLHTRIQVLTQH